MIGSRTSSVFADSIDFPCEKFVQSAVFAQTEELQADICPEDKYCSTGRPCAELICLRDTKPGFFERPGFFLVDYIYPLAQTAMARNGMEQQLDADQSARSESSQREIRYEHTPNLAEVLTGIRCSLLVSTYQAGKLVAIGARQHQLAMSFHNFDRPMGVATDARCSSLAVAARNKIWFLRSARGIAANVEPAGTYANCFVTQSAQVTGEIQAHEMSWIGDQLWIVNTLFSCLCRPDDHYSFVPQWRPPFISQLAAEDRCHLNGLAVSDGRPAYVTAMAETDSPGGWRPTKAESGCLIDVESGETIKRGFAMPHSPRVHAGYVWLLDSGRGTLVRVCPTDGRVETVGRFPGYARGLAIHQSLAFVGLSKIRETSTFDGVPIADDRERLKCGVAVVDLRTAELVAQFEFKTGVDEIFDVSLLPGQGLTAMRGPFSTEDGARTIWIVPEPGQKKST